MSEARPLLTRLDHVQLALPAGGEDEARRFYGELLGLAELAKPPVLAARGGVWFQGSQVVVHLGVEAEFRPARKAHPAFRASNLDALRARLTAAGVAVDRRILAELAVSDPAAFGSLVETAKAAL